MCRPAAASSALVAEAERPRVTYDGIAGCEEQKREVGRPAGVRSIGGNSALPLLLGLAKHCGGND